MVHLDRELVEAGSATILVVEDDAYLRALLLRTLRENGYRALSAGSGPEMARCLQSTPVDLILLDVMLPGANGFDLCRALRRTSDVPLIMLSARGDEADRFLGLELGADDYVAKPFSPRELMARIRANLRRANGGLKRPEPPRGQLRFGRWTLDPAQRELLSPERAVVDLSGAEFDLLLAFVSHPQRVIGRERLLELSRARVAEASDRSIDVLVSRLRRKLARDGDDEDAGGGLIRTVRGVGYMFASRVTRS